jgi:hypothetical protein
MPHPQGDRIDLAFDNDAKWRRHEARMNLLGKRTVVVACVLIGLGFGFLIWA